MQTTQKNIQQIGTPQFLAESPEATLARLVDQVNEIPGPGPYMKPIFETAGTDIAETPIAPGDITTHPDVISPHAYSPEGYHPQRPQTKFYSNEAHRDAARRQPIPLSPFQPGRTPRRPTAIGFAAVPNAAIGVETTVAQPVISEPQTRNVENSDPTDFPWQLGVGGSYERIETSERQVRRHSLGRQLGGYVLKVVFASAALFPVVDALMARE